MSRSRYDEPGPDWEPDEPAWQPDPADAPAWQPEPAWEPEREREPEFEYDPAEPGVQNAPSTRPNPRQLTGEGPAYLAAVAVLVVTFGLALLTTGVQGGPGPWTKPVLAVGLALLLLGLAMLALAAWLVGGLGPGKR